MKDKDFKKLSQEIRDVLLYNQAESRTLVDRIKQMDASDHSEETEALLSEQMRFLEERGISIDADSVLKDATMPEPEENTPVQELSWEEIVAMARNAGYIDVKIEDILTPEEIERANKEFEEITEAFEEKVRLTKVDIAFLTIAVLLQVIRQYFITTLSEPTRTEQTSKEAEEAYKEQYDQGGKYNNTYYRATKECILSQKFVPYDAIAGSKQANIGGDNKGISGTNHRYYTMGHDPALYAVVGTSNILTNTMTVADGRTFHVKYIPDKLGRERPTIVQEANTPKMFRKTWERIEQCSKSQLKVLQKLKSGKMPSKEEFEDLVESFVPFAAYIKAKRHLASDDSVNGLPIPFTQLFSPEFAKELSEYGFDAAGLAQVLKDAGKQMVGSVIINYIIAILHGVFCKAEYQEDLKFVKVRTRKVLLISNMIATSSNIVVTAAATVIAAYTGNEELAKTAYKHADIGGAIITMTRVFSDLTFISAIRNEFITGKLRAEMDKVFDEIEALEKDIVGD